MIPDIDRVVFSTPLVRVGAFRCPVAHQAFADSGPIADYCFVFPRTSVRIRHKDARAFPADPTLVTLYNRGQEYRREAVSPDGDRCDWYAVEERVLREAVEPYDPQGAGDAGRPIRFPFARIDAATYLLQRELFARATRGDAADALFVEEAVLTLLDTVLARAYQARRSAAVGSIGRSAAAIADAACALLGRRFAEPVTLAELADALNVSVFHLCRCFRAATGSTLHAYREQLRLRSALARLEERDGDLSLLALDLGYSSHSHFTASFRKAFGLTPSAARQRVRATS